MRSRITNKSRSKRGQVEMKDEKDGFHVVTHASFFPKVDQRCLCGPSTTLVTFREQPSKASFFHLANKCGRRKLPGKSHGCGSLIITTLTCHGQLSGLMKFWEMFALDPSDNTLDSLMDMVRRRGVDGCNVMVTSCLLATFNPQRSPPPPFSPSISPPISQRQPV